MADRLAPASEAELQSTLEGLAADRVSTEVVGSGSKRRIGRPTDAETVLSVEGLTGVTLYEPTELVMSARAGTRITEIEELLSQRGQMLAFEPIDLGPVCGGPARAQTIGGVIATNSSGARRIQSGAARDHLLGVRAVNGRGELFKSGGRVLKNVTGYDVARGLAGSWGTLSVLSEVTFKVLPRPVQTATLVYRGLSDEIAVELMCAALGTAFEVSGTAHLTPGFAPRLALQDLASEVGAITAIRIENFPTSVAYRTDRLKDALKVFGVPVTLGNDASRSLWSDLQGLQPLATGQKGAASQVWKISTGPRRAARVIDAIRRSTHGLEAYYDASGGIVWVEFAAVADAGAADIRRVLATHGGHATLIRAEDAVRSSVEVFHPQTAPVRRITAGIKEAFDPVGILNPGRMYQGV